MIPINIMKNEMPMAKKLAASRTTTRTEKTRRNTPVRLVILVLAGLGCVDNSNPTMSSGVELIPLLVEILNSYIQRSRSRGLSFESVHTLPSEGWHLQLSQDASPAIYKEC